MICALVKEDRAHYSASQVNQDGLWKKVIEELFEDFLLFFVPDLHKHIDFSYKPDFLDKELFQEVMDGQKGRRFADRLAKVRLKNGEEQWILIHVEVQSKNEAEFPDRMFQYFYRIFDRYNEKIVAIAVHTSKNKSTSLEQFEYDYFGTNLRYSYNNYRTEDFTDEELERSNKLFSKVVLAAKAMHQTKNEGGQRFLFKRKLMRELVCNKKYSRTAVQTVLHFVDYLLQLPEKYTKQLSEEIRPIIREEPKLMELYNKENASPTIMNAFDLEWQKGKIEGEKAGREEGIEEGRKEGKMEERHVIGRKLLLESMELEKVSAVTGLTLEEIEEILKTIN